jgi:hypothetical protein
VSESVGSPDAAVTDEAFFRKYKRLPEADLTRLEQKLCSSSNKGEEHGDYHRMGTCT